MIIAFASLMLVIVAVIGRNLPDFTEQRLIKLWKELDR